MSEKYYFEDLTGYSRNISPIELEGVKNVGWIDIFGNFDKGVVPDEFLKKLGLILSSPNQFHPLVEPSRGLPKCPECGVIKLKVSDKFNLPDGGDMDTRYQ